MSIGWKQKCFRCSRGITLTKKNTVCHLYRRQTWFMHFVVNCQCGVMGRVFLIDISDVAAARASGIPVVQLDFAPDEVVRAYEMICGVKMPKPRPLTPREERRIAFERYLLERGELP